MQNKGITLSGYTVLKARFIQKMAKKFSALKMYCMVPEDKL